MIAWLTHLQHTRGKNVWFVGILDEKLELERWRLTAQYVAAADTRSHGLGDVRKYLLEQQVDQVTEVFGLKTRPSAEGIFNRAMLPSVAERTLKA